jgi:Cu(I)/Ag(I) efflux system membrane protein CusA/SilA
LPAGYAIAWSGQYEGHAARARAAECCIVPITLACIALLLYLNTGSMVKTAMIALAVPFSAVGAICDASTCSITTLSVGVWVGLIALVGVDAETGSVFMLPLPGSCVCTGEIRRTAQHCCANLQARNRPRRGTAGSARRS